MVIAKLSTRDKAGVVFFGGLISVTAYLGTWQVQRYNWKVDLLRNRKENLDKTPLLLNKTLLEGNKNSKLNCFRRLKCKGEFDYSKTMFVGPRSSPKAMKGNSKAIGQSGFLVVSPFVIREEIGEDKSNLCQNDSENQSNNVLVIRGWVNRNEKEQMLKSNNYKLISPDNNDKYEIEEFEAIVSEKEIPGKFTPDNDFNNRSFYYLDVDGMSSQAGFLGNETLLIERVNGSPEDSLKTNSTDLLHEHKVHPATHAGYAATWYGFACAGLWVMKRKFF